MVIPFLQDILITMTLLLVGTLVARFILGTQHPLAHISLAFPLGGGLLTWIIFIASWLGLQDLKATVIVVTMLLLIALLLGGKAFRWPKLRRSSLFQTGDLRRRTRLTLWPLVIWSILGLIFVAALIISIGRSYAAWDAVAFWSLKGYGMAWSNSLLAYGRWGGHGFSYPPNIPLLISIFSMVNGDILPGSKILFPLYYVSIILGSYRFWKRTGVKSIPSMLGLLFMASIPIVFEFATVGYSNLPAACFLALAVLWGAEGIFMKLDRAQMMSGILFGLAVWTRPEGILFSLFGVAALMLSSRLMRRGKINYASFLLPILLIGGSWLTFYSLHGGGDSQAMGGVKAAIGSIFSGDFHFIAVVEIISFAIRNAIEVKNWGLLFPFSLLAFIAALRSIKGRVNPFFWSCFACGTAFGILTLTLFYVGQFNFESGFLQGWLGRGFARALIPAGVLFAVMCVNSFGEINFKSTTE